MTQLLMDLHQSLVYMVGANPTAFFQAMGMVVGTSMFLGATLHNGDLKSAQKAVATIVPYSIILSWTNLSRVLPNVMHGIVNEKTYTATLTTIFVTIAYCIGLYIGVSISNRKGCIFGRKKSRDKPGRA